jgi:hypothetical protein
VPASDETYGGGKVKLEETLLQADRLPVAVLRPAAVCGPGSRRDRHLSLQADRLARRSQALLHESIEARLFVPDLDDAEAELGGSGQMEVDTTLGSSLDPQFVHDRAVLVRLQTVDI